MTAHLKSTCSAIFNCVIGGVLLGLFTAAFADDAPLSYVAEPDASNSCYLETGTA